MKGLWRRWAELFEEEGPDEPRYDPIQLASVLVGALASVGALFWLLWALLVYEGGPLSSEGRPVRAAALLTALALLLALRRADREHAGKSR